MASRTSRILITLGILALGTILHHPGSVMGQDETDEVVIEGEDKQPATSSFEYGDTEADTVDYSNLGTKDFPRPEEPSPFREPRLDRDTGTIDHAELEQSQTTAVDEFSTTELLLIGAGVVATLLVI